MTDIWFIRHGESTSNAGEVAFDRHSTKLTALGEQQAVEACAKIPHAPELVVVTPYIRTHQTAAPLLARFPQAPVEEWPLQEFSILSDEKYIGTVMADRLPLFRDYWELCDPHYVDGAGAESFAAMLARVRAGLAALAARRGFTVVFAHGFILQAVQLALTQPEADERDLLRQLGTLVRERFMENGTIVRVRREAGGLRLLEEAAFLQKEFAD